MADRVPIDPARQSEITRAAAALFEERGFHATSMEDIAEAIGIRKPTLYHYVKSKAQIVFWIHDECVSTVLPPIRELVSQNAAPEQILLECMAGTFRLLQEKPGYLRVYFEHHRELDPPDRMRTRRQRDEYFALVQAAVQHGIDDGRFLHDIDAQTATLAFFGMANWGYQWYHPENPDAAMRYAQQFCDLFLAGLTTESRPVGPR